MDRLSINRNRLLNAIDEAKNSSRIYNKFKIMNLYKVIKNNDEHFLSVSVKNPTLVEYSLNGGKFSDRISTTLARYVRRQLGISNTRMYDSELEAFSIVVLNRVLKKERNFKDIVKVLKGQSILDFYIEAKHKTPSCMTGFENAHKIQMYAKNPNKICLVVSKDKARGLLWSADDGQKLLDYVYPFNSAISEVLIGWGLSRGYHCVADSSYQENKPLIKVTVETTEFYPRLDTLYYVVLNKKNKTAILCNEPQKNITHTMFRTDGDIDVYDGCYL